MKWSYGVTTVPSRRSTVFPRTLASLRASGFDSPRIFLDDATHALAASYETEYALEVTVRTPKIATYGNWILALAELYIRTPNADRYAIFQDDLVTAKNLRAYLERVPYPEDTYLNLYTFPENEVLSRGHRGFYPSNQRGRGAVALVFSRLAVQVLLVSQHMVDRPKDVSLSRTGVPKGQRNVDGGVIQAMRNAGWREMVHSPSLVQHTGLRTSMKSVRQWPVSKTFPGEEFDLLNLLH